MRVLGEDFELFWVSDERGENWTLSKSLQQKLGLPGVVRGSAVESVVHPRDRTRILNALRRAHENKESVDVSFHIYLPDNQVFVKARLIGWPRFCNSQFIGHIGFWRIKLPSLDF